MEVQILAMGTMIKSIGERTGLRISNMNVFRSTESEVFLMHLTGNIKYAIGSIVWS